MRVLFVDDEEKVLKGIERMLEDDDCDWDLETAIGAAEALESMSESPVDVLISDMRMPGIDGAQLLNEVAIKYPNTVRIILSGQADKDAVYRAIGPMHQFLAKPCRAEVLRDTVEKSCALKKKLDFTKANDFIATISSLPSLPSIYQELVSAIESDAVTVAKVGRIIEQDPAISAKILQLANSAIFGLRASVKSPSQAAALIGLEPLKALVLSLQVFKTFDGVTIPGFSIDELVLHSVRVAGSAKTIAKAEGLSEDEQSEAFTTGLLHDLGKLIFASSAPERYASAFQRPPGENRPFTEIERDIFGLDHADIGSYLLSLWGLPQSIVQGVAFHHQVSLEDKELNSEIVVKLANQLVRMESIGEDVGEFELLHAQLEKLALTHRLDDWRELIADATDSVG